MKRNNFIILYLYFDYFLSLDEKELMDRRDNGRHKRPCHPKKKKIIIKYCIPSLFVLLSIQYFYSFVNGVLSFGCTGGPLIPAKCARKQTTLM